MRLACEVSLWRVRMVDISLRREGQSVLVDDRGITGQCLIAQSVHQFVQRISGHLSSTSRPGGVYPDDPIRRDVLLGVPLDGILGQAEFDCD